MWSYSFEVPILLILGIILLFYFSRPRLKIRRNNVFLGVILIETLTICIDICATKADINYSSYAVSLINFVNMLYFVAFFIRAYFLYQLPVSVLKISPGKQKIFRPLIRIPLYIGILMSVHSMISGSPEARYFIYYVDDAGYHSGGMYHILYFIGFFYVLMSFLCSVLYSDSLGRRREKYGMLMYNVIVLFAYVFRLAFPKLLIMDTILFMSILVVYLAFINPEYFLDLRAVTFNSSALRQHLMERHDRLRNVSAGMAVRNYQAMRDIYGYLQMEEGLAVIGKYLKQVFPNGEIFYYRNGRFVILDKAGTDFEEKFKTISERFNHPWKSQSVEVYLTVGFALFEPPKETYSPETVLNTMLKTLEKAGENESESLIRSTEEDLKRTESEAVVRKSIESAIDHDGFVLFLQPIVDAGSGKVIGAEALARIKDLDGKIIPPGIFIPVAESSGRINALGEVVFDRTCKFIAEKGLESMGIEWINVNLSPSQFIRIDLAERYSSIVDKYGIDPGSVHLEITEGAMIDDSFLQKQIGAMTEKGFKFVLDDYGTGYSNLARLKKCPFINIKLDMSIVWDYCKERDELLPNMIQTFKKMGFRITAEGIEDDVMVSAMKEIGCDLLQGYHYSKPVSAEEFAEKYSV